MGGRKLLTRFLSDTRQSSADLCRAGGFSTGLFARWLSGDRTPSLRHAFTLERVTAGRVPASSWIASKRKRSRAA